jgi:uncharacterized delta-60 repeat protein
MEAGREAPAGSSILASVVALIALAGCGGASGGLDPRFGSNGQVRVDFAPYVVAIQSDGKIVVAGSKRLSRNGSLEIVVARLTRSGERDRGFGSSGEVVTDAGKAAGLGTDAIPEGVGIQPGGRIVVAASLQDGEHRSALALIRYTKQGVLDRRFGRDGVILTDLGSGDIALSDPPNFGFSLAPDGSILALGDTVLVRFNPNGVVDENYGSGGIKFNWHPCGIDTFAVQKDGRVVTAGEDTKGDFCITRLTPNGELDRSFGGNGVAQAYDRTNDGIGGIAFQSGGRIVVVATKYTGSDTSEAGGDFALIRLTSKGLLDHSFGKAGATVTDIGAYSTAVSPHGAMAVGLATEKDSKIVVVGDVLNCINACTTVIARYTANGTLDPSFGDRGVLTTNEAEDHASAAVQADRKLVIVGGTSSVSDSGFNSVSGNPIVRYKAQGR